MVPASPPKLKYRKYLLTTLRIDPHFQTSVLTFASVDEANTSILNRNLLGPLGKLITYQERESKFNHKEISLYQF